MSAASDFEVIVVGGGHAGAEAALAAARMGVRTAMVVLDPAAVGRMSCNPAIGGLAKGQLVREIDALGGEMGLVTDATGIHFRMLNTSKGPAVRSPRAQCDRHAYNNAMAARVAAQVNLTVVADEAIGIVVESSHNHPSGRRVRGITLATGGTLLAPLVVITTGTFLGGKLFAGEWTESGGRMGERGPARLSASLAALGLRLGRHKTGTPPRLARDSIDFSVCERQDPDDPPQPFSFRTERITTRQLPCWTTRTTARTHSIVAGNAHRSPMFAGRIVGTGPRYCPSLEDKVVRFADKDHHLIFLEPEGHDADEVYPNGISTSLPPDIQGEFVRTIPGLEDARILRHGYAVEYDFLCTDQIRSDLSVASVDGLFSAGQVNGTSGYEEAAAQGFLAGVNAARRARGSASLVLDRASSYLGVMVDDLCRVNPTEPYRMFTSRAEFRLMLRSDNADRRLAALAQEIGILGERDRARVAGKERRIELALERLTRTRVDGSTLVEWLRRPEIDAGDPRILAAVQDLQLSVGDLSEVEAEVKYAGYIERQLRDVERLRAMEARAIPAAFEPDRVVGLSNEAKDRLRRHRPRTIGEASRLPGVTPADVQLLLVHVRR
ncbi:MAG: tRNA uridine-5-carboxymethylaminomethyl(34) synthesis enzyme MnmG [Planctomycetota bacterium]